jgi:hypothetical protein
MIHHRIAPHKLPWKKIVPWRGWIHFIAHVIIEQWLHVVCNKHTCVKWAHWATPPSATAIALLKEQQQQQQQPVARHTVGIHRQCIAIHNQTVGTVWVLRVRVLQLFVCSPDLFVSSCVCFFCDRCPVECTVLCWHASDCLMQQGDQCYRTHSSSAPYTLTRIRMLWRRCILCL